jgi:hypothetical protein
LLHLLTSHDRDRSAKSAAGATSRAIEAMTPSHESMMIDDGF